MYARSAFEHPSRFPSPPPLSSPRSPSTAFHPAAPLQPLSSLAVHVHSPRPLPVLAARPWQSDCTLRPSPHSFVSRISANSSSFFHSRALVQKTRGTPLTIRWLALKLSTWNFPLVPLTPFLATLTEHHSRKSFACHSCEKVPGVGVSTQLLPAFRVRELALAFAAHTAPRTLLTKSQERTPAWVVVPMSQMGRNQGGIPRCARDDSLGALG
jgi:hypothetical protein